jgi:hypothetical protein
VSVIVIFLTASSLASTAQATTVRDVSCSGSTNVASGTLVRLHLGGWIAANPGLVEAFRHGNTVVLTANGVVIPVSETDWSEPEPFSDATHSNDWITFWTHLLESPITSTTTFVWTVTLNHPMIPDPSVPGGGRPFQFEAGTVWHVSTCTVTVADITVSGHVQDATGAPVGNVHVRVFDATNGSCCAATATTGADGSYTLLVAAGQYRLAFYPPTSTGLAGAFWPSATTYSGATTLIVTADTLADIVLPPGALVTATIHTAAGLPFPNARVIVGSGAGLVNEAATTDSAGVLAVRLVNGVYTIDIYPPGSCCTGSPLTRIDVTVSGVDQDVGTFVLP